jgi:hypothetical protein
MVEARRRPEAAHVRSAPSPRLIFFLCVALWRCGVGQWHLMPGRRRPHGLSEMMAAMPPRPKGL